MIAWPEQLKRDLVSRRVAILFGSGVSRNSISQDGLRRPPLWKEFLDSGLQRIGGRNTRHIKNAIKSNDLLHACEWIKKRIDDDWVPFLRGCFIDPGYKPAQIHEYMLNLDQRVYLTPNFDQIFENYVISENAGQVTVKKYCDEDVHNFLREDSIHIIKIHGSIDNPGSLIFTNEDYARARIKYSAFYDVLDACLLSHTFLILGCGMHDPDLALLLENQRFNFPNSRPHYFVTSENISDDMVRSLRSNRNLKCLTYNSKNDHEELMMSLKELVDLMDASAPGPTGIFA